MNAGLVTIQFGTSGWRTRVQTTDGLDLNLDGGAWVLVRRSGAEPVACLHVEARDEVFVEGDTTVRHSFA